MMNANLPLSEGNLVDAMEAADPESFHGVPYALKLLSETEGGIQALKKCKLVLYGGSSCPDEVGDELVRQGVYVVGHYGAYVYHVRLCRPLANSRSMTERKWVSS